MTRTSPPKPKDNHCCDKCFEWINIQPKNTFRKAIFFLPQCKNIACKCHVELCSKNKVDKSTTEKSCGFQESYEAVVKFDKLK